MRFRLASLGVLILASTAVAQSPNWVQVQTKNSPPARWRHATAHDSIRDRTIVFGGCGVTISYLNDTWEYDGNNWVEIKPATKPTARRLSAMVYHLARQQALLFGRFR